jgi:hypothetical protein
LITDPIRDIDIAPQQRVKNLVVYNGTKGRWLVPQLQERMPDVEFRPLQGMSYREVCENLAQASAYVELGLLHGRDRLPREAAQLGTPVIFVARGSAYCWADAPLPLEYRIPYQENWAELTIPVIRDVLSNPESAADRQLTYREWVAGEKDRYEGAVDLWLQEALTK